MAKILAFAEFKEGQPRAVAAEAVAAARTLAGPEGTVVALCMGGPGLEAGAASLGSSGADEVLLLEHPVLSEYAPELWARALADRVREEGARALLFPATSVGRDLAPRIAALLDVPLASEVTELRTAEDGAVVARRPVYSGKAFSRVRIAATPALVTLRANAFGVEVPAGAGVVRSVEVSIPEGVAASKVAGFEAASGGAVDVSEAAIVVSGGRGLKGPEHWGLLEDLVAALGEGAALGASRAVVDAGWRPHGEQVGQTGKTVAPRLYVAVGISGAIQHLAGMRTAGTIVAVNRDPDAPIFQIADYGIVGDLFEVLPGLTSEVTALRDRS